MDAALTGLIGTGIGAVAGILGSTMTERHQSRTERERTRAARADELTRAARQALLDLVQLIAAGTHAISWLAWSVAEQPPDQVLLEADKYNASMRELFPILVKAQVAAASLSKNSYERIDPLVDQLFDLDREVGTALEAFKRGEPDANARIAAARNAAATLDDHMLNEARSLLATGAD
jgi:hypothetical protein